MTPHPKLTAPQEVLLYDLCEFRGVDGMYVSESYKPAKRLVALGLARWLHADALVATPEGRAELKARVAVGREALKASP